MTDDIHSGEDKALSAWCREVLDEAVNDLMRRGVVDTDLVEAKPAWILPYQIMIGKVRHINAQNDFAWVIAGEVPVDYVSSTAAIEPRQAARHFALKWQLDANKYLDPDVQNELDADQKQHWIQQSETLANKAEALYEMVETTSLWRETNHS